MDPNKVVEYYHSSFDNTNRYIDEIDSYIDWQLASYIGNDMPHKVSTWFIDSSNLRHFLWSIDIIKKFTWSLRLMIER